MRFDENKQPIPVSKWEELPEPLVTSASCSDVTDVISQSEAQSAYQPTVSNILLQMKESTHQICKYRYVSTHCHSISMCV